jgi:hypothetical protein
MNFERTNNPLTSLDIGRIANPIKVFRMFVVDPSENIAYPGSGDMTDKDCRRILEGISKRELGLGWEDRYYIGLIVKGKEVKPYIINFEIFPIKNYIEYYLEFQGVKYFIPKP